MKTLVSNLRVCARARRLSVPALARELGISTSYAHMLLNGERGFGVQALRGIVRAFPEMGPEVLDYLRDGHEDDA